jgi:hypothetical protein
MSILVIVAVVIAFAWWWLSRARVSPAPVALMQTRIVFPGGVRLADPDGAIARLRMPDEIVIPFPQATLAIDYPLTTPTTVQIAAGIPQGFTRAELIRDICEEYANVYEAEDGTATTKPIPREERAEGAGRNRTDGVYGIWGYDLEDLVLTAVRWTRHPDGTVAIELHVETPAAS